MRPGRRPYTVHPFAVIFGAAVALVCIFAVKPPMCPNLAPEDPELAGNPGEISGESADTSPAADPIAIVKPLVRHFETLRLEAYFDNARVAIGYGHDLPIGTDIDDVAAIDQAGAEQLLDRDLAIAAHYVDRYVGHVGLEAYQTAALIDFVYNLGPGHFERSTLRGVIVGGDLARVPGEFRRWVYADGKRSANLEARREAEIRMFDGHDWRPKPFQRRPSP